MIHFIALVDGAYLKCSSIASAEVTVKDPSPLFSLVGYHNAFDNTKQYNRQRHMPQCLLNGVPMPAMFLALEIRRSPDTYFASFLHTLEASIQYYI